MSLPDLEDPVDLAVAAQARDRPAVFSSTAQHWTWAYASPTSPVVGLEERVGRVAARLGVGKEARERLAVVYWGDEDVGAEGKGVV